MECANIITREVLMIRKIFLILCLAFGVLAFGYPCLILPVGSYTQTITKDDVSSTLSYNFHWNGKVTQTMILEPKGGEKTEDVKEFFYKLDWKNGVRISEDKNFDDKDALLPIANVFRITGPLGIYQLRNQLAMWISIAVGVVDLLLIVTIPRKHK